MPIERNKSKKNLFFYICAINARSILNSVRGGSWQVAEFLPNYLKGAVKNIIWMRKKQIICQILKYLYSKPSRNIFIKSAGVFWSWQNFFLYLAWPGLATVGKKQFSKTIQFKKSKNIFLGSFTYFATTTNCFFPFWKFDPA